MLFQRGLDGLELEPEDFMTLMDDDLRKQVVDKFKSIGYLYVTLDLQGFRSGSLNEVLAGLKKKANA